ncbi:hypothetical protein C500_18915 [Natrialba magadii ATCC 43099]|uniref:Uncharacterized protein n=2 Tax=Natrialba magadii (strain ATCC 43099 / DSM 3394 / CCM 3739 / CIP 104546 / IAM 13178 / JCM 8861 / NBRC 102185 / NCIMB 2190 / MS3) TaxID=547559 RepID=L9UHT3_NATMM|nr:hypothetical protein [Natrialba magadii]ELY24444.1 hypothetical protein C500_18915 [Natrialba magadii ATCC 43099]
MADPFERWQLAPVSGRLFFPYTERPPMPATWGDLFDRAESAEITLEQVRSTAAELTDDETASGETDG